MNLKSLILAVIVALLFVTDAFGAHGAKAAGSLTVEVVVEGQDQTVDVFWVVVLPADITEPVSFDEVQAFAHEVKAGQLKISGLAPGRYIVALILSPSNLSEATERLLAVETNEGIGYWPAFEVEVADDNVPSVRFVRQALPAIPDSFVIPHTGPASSEPDTPQSGATAAPAATAQPALTGEETRMKPPDTGTAGLR